ncbi:MAG: flagellar hook-basal body complex protein [Planctomycetota bacterium]|nr:flagellar hook-basal body complex protein [Planctomycetota bacterium]MEC9158717.1 flagellar hook-basal body complex protein [Planctomycetota bacterium]MED5507396.1 flagellar hook-basal body complex protein [Planctomycetota bacterium]
MASTTALFTGLSGLLSNSRRLDVIGNNIANVNTTAFKSNRMAFAPTFSRNFSLGTAPGSSTGGSNPGQVGLGVSVSGTQRNFANGAIGATGVNTDMAIEGAGFFIVEGAGERYYTRDGSFVRNPSNDLVTQNGARVLGFDVDEQFNVIEGNLVPLNIPVGTLTLAESTQEVIFNGNLNASGDVGAQGSQHRSRAFFTDAGGTVPVTGNEDLASDLWVSDGLGGTSLAFDSSSGGPIEITISGIEKGGKDLGTHTFTYGVDGTTLNDFTGWLDEVLGLDSTNIGGESLGGSVSFNASGQLVINGNEGTVQGFDIDSADIVVTGNTGAAGGLGQPFIMSQTQEPIGESVRTSFVVYDSLGTPVTVDLSFVLQDTNSSGGTVWEFVAETNDNAIDDRLIGLGVVEFDANGRYVSSTNQSFQIVRDNGAVTPLTVSMNFDSGTDSVSALTDTVSNLAAVYQDGSPIGTLSNFSIGEDGVISGAFTNGLTRSIGQVALAKFANPEGLVDAGNNLFTSGPNSGTPLIADPLEFGTGRVVGGALELSNVDLSQEFINMILASTGYSAASRVITTTDELINQLLVLGR